MALSAEPYPAQIAICDPDITANLSYLRRLTSLPIPYWWAFRWLLSWIKLKWCLGNGQH